MRKETLKAIEEILEGLTFLGYAGVTLDILHQSILSLLVVTTGTDAYSEYCKRTAGEHSILRALRFLGPSLECVSAFMLLRSELTYPDTPESVFLKQIDLAVFSMVVALKTLYANEISFGSGTTVSGLISVAFQSLKGYKSIPKLPMAVIGFFSSARGLINLFAASPDPERSFQR